MISTMQGGQGCFIGTTTTVKQLHMGCFALQTIDDNNHEKAALSRKNTEAKSQGTGLPVIQ